MRSGYFFEGIRKKRNANFILFFLGMTWLLASITQLFEEDVTNRGGRSRAYYPTCELQTG